MFNNGRLPPKYVEYTVPTEAGNRFDIWPFSFGHFVSPWSWFLKSPFYSTPLALRPPPHTGKSTVYFNVTFPDWGCWHSRKKAHSLEQWLREFQRGKLFSIWWIAAEAFEKWLTNYWAIFQKAFKLWTGIIPNRQVFQYFHSHKDMSLHVWSNVKGKRTQRFFWGDFHQAGMK